MVLRILFCLLPFATMAQGKLMLVGGGAEEEGGWSDLPYGWAVDQSANKKVAVISYSDEDNFIPDYFISLGAAEAVNIKLDSRNLSDLQATYDLLMQYDVFFFKGGDQSYYYEYFKGTKTQSAIVDKFNAGGVITGTSAGMAILSGVIFTAEKGSVYPDEVLQDFSRSSVTLANDFLPFFPGYLFDSHFTERGRVARLLGFMANWYVENNEALMGIGVDDRTAFCIGPDQQGIVYGTGTVSIVNSLSFSAYQDDKPVADSIHVVQLLHGHTYDLPQSEIINGPTELITPNPESETGNYGVVLSGSEGVSTNTEFLNYFAKEAGNLTDTVVLVTAPGKGKSYQQKLTELQVNVILVESSASFNDAGKLDLRNSIRRSRKVLFAENDDNLLFDFLKNGPTGMLIDKHIRRNNLVTGFIGEDSRYAGKVFVTNHLSDIYAAYYGRLIYKPGLALLRSSVIMSNTYDASSTDYYENTTAAVSYAVIAEKVKFGLYLNRNSYIRFYQEEARSYFQAKGNLSAIVMTNNPTTATLASQPVNSGGSKRDYSSFSSMQYSLLNGGATIFAGIPHTTSDLPYEFEMPVVGAEHEVHALSATIFPNPSATGMFHFSTDAYRPVTLTVMDLTGRVIWRHSSWNSQLDLSSYPDGLYFATFSSGSEYGAVKIVKGGSMTE